MYDFRISCTSCTMINLQLGNTAQHMDTLKVKGAMFYVWPPGSNAFSFKKTIIVYNKNTPAFLILHERFKLRGQ